MTARMDMATSFGQWAGRDRRAMEVLWLLTVFLVPLIFATPGVMDNGSEVPRVTLYRSLVGLLAAMWVIEWGLFLHPRKAIVPRVSLTTAKGWLAGQPTRWILVAALAILASNLVSTLFSASIPISLWGSEPASDGYSFYNTICHFVLFAILVTHLKTPAQLWRLLTAIIASGAAVSSYGILQYFGLDPFALHIVGTRVISSMGNSIRVGAFLLMVVPLALAMVLRHQRSPISLTVTGLWFGALTAILLAIAFSQGRGAWLGLAVALASFVTMVSVSLGWRITARSVAALAVSVAIVWLVVSFVPPAYSAGPAPPFGQAALVAQALSIGKEVRAEVRAQVASELGPSTTEPVAAHSSLGARMLIWQGAGRLVLNRPWFEFGGRVSPPTLHLFGYGPEFFQYLFPLEHPPELTDVQRNRVYRNARDAHNNLVHVTLELGAVGLASYLFLMGAVFATIIVLLVKRRPTHDINQTLVIIALLASLAGRAVEQLVGIPRLSDVAFSWVFLAILVALPGIYGNLVRRNENDLDSGSRYSSSSLTSTKVGGVVLRLSLAMVIASVVVVFTIIKNPFYALASHRAAESSTSLGQGDLPRAIRQIDGAIALAPDVGGYHAQRAIILDEARDLTTSGKGTRRLAHEAYAANQQAIEANAFDFYNRMQFAGSALTLARYGETGMREKAIEEYRRLTITVPRHWLSHFLLGNAYSELGQTAQAIAAFDESIRLNPQFALTYNQRGIAYADLGQHQQAIENYDEAIRLSPRGLASARNNRGTAYLALGQLERAIESYNEAIRINSRLTLAYNNRGTVYYQLGQLERAIEDYDRAISLNPQFAQAYANRALANLLLDRNAHAQKDADRALELGFPRALLEENLGVQKEQP